MSTTKRQERIKKLIDTFPPLTTEQQEHLAALLSIQRDINAMRRDLRQVAK